jgi:hypothetical protein
LLFLSVFLVLRFQFTKGGSGGIAFHDIGQVGQFQRCLFGLVDNARHPRETQSTAAGCLGLGAWFEWGSCLVHLDVEGWLYVPRNAEWNGKVGLKNENLGSIWFGMGRLVVRAKELECRIRMEWMEWEGW